MIVREILDKPELIDDFDFFNDAIDTARWLRSIPGYSSLEGHALADKLELAAIKALSSGLP